jgi:hypothetical protein
MNESLQIKILKLKKNELYKYIVIFNFFIIRIGILTMLVLIVLNYYIDIVQFFLLSLMWVHLVTMIISGTIIPLRKLNYDYERNKIKNVKIRFAMRVSFSIVLMFLTALLLGI